MTNEHRNETILKIKITGMKKRYSDPKVFIPKKNGRATIAPGRRWHVYFYWRTDPEGPLNKKYKYYRGLNRLKTVRERKKMGKALADAYRMALDRGWDPETGETKTKKEIITLGVALDRALKNKSANIKEATRIDYTFRLGVFKDWLQEKYLLQLPAKEIKIDHIYDFMDYLQQDYKKENGKKLSNTSIDNTRRVISALFTEMKNQRIIDYNFVRDIPKLKGKATKNKPFTPSQIKDIKRHLLEVDPYMVHFLAFMIYPVLRPREIVRLQVGDINTRDWLITVETKTRAYSINRIIEKLKPTIGAMGIHGQPKNYSLFSPEDKPAPWETKRLDSKVSYFSKRFTKVIREMGFTDDYTLYSVRHTAIWSLYNGMQAQGKNEREIIQNLIPITGHKSEAGLRNYLREIQIIIPPDHSDIYGFDF